MTTTARDLAHLHAAILADPSDDLPRLAMADALEESGDATGRAEFIRVQVEIADIQGRSRRHEINGDALHRAARRVTMLCRREDELFADSGPKWWGDLPGAWRATVAASASVESAEGWKFEVRRGFVSSISLPLAAFERHAEAIFRAHPVTDVRLTDRKPWASSRNYVCWLNAECFKPKQSNSNAECAKIPGEVFMRLLAGEVSPSGRGLRYPDIDAGGLALSSALVAHGRAQAKLPQLPRRA